MNVMSLGQMYGRQAANAGRRMRDRLLGGAEAGAFTLPPALADAMAALAVLEAAAHEANAALTACNPLVVQESLQHATVAAALAGKPLPGADPVMEQYARHDALEVLADARTAAVDAYAGAGIRGAIAQHAEELVVDHLRPAFATVLVETGKAAGKVGGVTDRGDGRLDAPGARKAFDALRDELHPRFRALRAAYAVVWTAAFARQVDEYALPFVEYRNASEMKLGEFGQPVPPTDPVPYMVWLATSNPRPEPWLPLPADLAPLAAEARKEHDEKRDSDRAFRGAMATGRPQ